MKATADLVILAWIPIGLAMFLGMKPWKAVLANFIIGWLFLPMARFRVDGVPDLDKILSISLTCLLGVVLFDARSLLRLRWRWFDVPIVGFAFSAMAASLSNELGLWDGLSASLAIVGAWLIPYVLGRAYFHDPVGMRRLATAVFIGGLIYMPFCLFEMKMSPFLHKAIYGYHAHSFAQTKRWGGFRPVVFMEHGLMVGLWMASATICGYWLWACKSLRQLWGIPAGWLVAALAITAVLCKSFGAVALLALALVLLRLGSRRGPLAMRVLIVLIPIYMIARISGWDGDEVANLADRISTERGGSLRYRFEMEVKLLKKALQQPLFGWGGWSRSRVFDWRGVDRSVTDSTWIIVLGQKGMLGLAGLTISLLLGLVMRTWRHGLRKLVVPERAAEAALCLVVLIYAYDCLVNAMHNPVYAIVLGAIAGAAPVAAASRRAPTSAPPPRKRRPSHWRVGPSRGGGEPEAVSARERLPGDGAPAEPQA